MLSPVSMEGFSIVPAFTAREISVTFSGSCDSQSIATLQGFVEALHAEAVRLSVRMVVLHCDALYFMNSAAVKCFTTWLSKISTLREEEQYRVAVRTNANLAWQQRSFGAVSRSAPGILKVD